MSDESGYPVLLIGLDGPSKAEVESLCEGALYTVIHDATEFEKAFESWQDGMFNAVFAGSEAGLPANELAQVLQNQCPETKKFFVATDPKVWEPRLLLKNGFNQCLQLPLDRSLLKEACLTYVITGEKKKRVYKGVRVLDLGEGDRLDFETYAFLPLNRKYIKLSAKGEGLTEKKLEKLAEKQVGQVFVDQKDMAQFYQYTASKLRSLGAGAVSSTERQEKLRESVRGLFQDIFDSSVKGDFDHGKEMISQVEGIISSYVTKGATSQWYKKLLSSIGDTGDSYSHASNVSTVAALFAIGIGHPRPEDIAMAGLFHDLGLTELPVELQSIPEWEVKPELRELFYSHLERSMNRVKIKRIIVPPEVEKAILQHHEKWSGKGGPKGLPAGRISDDAMILSFADQFDYLTRLEEGKRHLSPLEAYEEIKRNGSINPEILAKIRRLLEKEASEGSHGSRAEKHS